MSENQKEQSNQEGKEEKESEISVITPDGKLKVLKAFGIKSENRKIQLFQLEDRTVGISVIRYVEDDENPYKEEITNQVMRLSELTFSMLIACVLKANDDFGIDAEKIIEELNQKIRNNEKNI